MIMNTSCLNQTDTFCLTECQNIAFLYWNTRLILSLVFLPIAIVAIILNTLVVWVIIKTRQTGNQSIKLIMYLSMVDTLVAVFLTSSIVIPVLVIEFLPCSVYKALYFMRHLTFYSSCYIAALTGVDRYCRIQFKHEYLWKFNTKRFRIVFLVNYCMILWQTILACAMNFPSKHGAAATYLIPMNVTVSLIMVTLYFKTLHTLRQDQRNLLQLSNSIKFVCKISRLYFIMFGTGYSLLAVYQIISRRVLVKHLSIHSLGLLPIWYHAVVIFMSIVNAGYFLKINRRGRRKVKDLMRKFRRYLSIQNTNQIGDLPMERPRVVRIRVESQSS